jgi:PKD repeat protein
VFAANTSYQTGVSITQYEWDLDGDSTYEQNTGGTPMATHTYTVAGSFTARVRVTDSTGYTASNTVTITVQ